MTFDPLNEPILSKLWQEIEADELKRMDGRPCFRIFLRDRKEMVIQEYSRAELTQIGDLAKKRMTDQRLSVAQGVYAHRVHRAVQDALRMRRPHFNH